MRRAEVSSRCSMLSMSLSLALQLLDRARLSLLRQGIDITACPSFTTRLLTACLWCWQEQREAARQREIAQRAQVCLLLGFEGILSIIPSEVLLEVNIGRQASQRQAMHILDCSPN